MDVKEKILLPVKRVPGGVELDHKKNTAESKSEIMPAPDEVIIPMLQNIGAPCKILVKVGDKVDVGTKIGDTDEFLACPVYSSVSGTVKEIIKMKVSGREVDAAVIESDSKMSLSDEISPKPVSTKKELADACREAGIVGLGGAGFPTFVKIAVKDDVHIDTVIINGAECEPYITSDYRCAMEDSYDVLGGIRILLECLDIDRVVLAIENNKKPAIKKLYEIATGENDPDDRIKVMELKSRYPQGAEKQLIYSVTGRTVPNGKLPSDVGCIIINISTVAAIYRYIRTGIPLVSRRVTVDGSAVKKPKNVIVPIGTKVRDLINYCGGFIDEPEKVLMGGPMMGRAAENIDNEVILKQSNAVLAFLPEKIKNITACIRCARCASRCPMKLYPMKIAAAVETGDVETLKVFHPECCIECGSCAYICPASRPLTQSCRIGKKMLRSAK